MSATALLRLSALGDILLCEPVVRVLKEREPNRPLIFITKERFAEIPRGWPDVDHVLALPDPIDGRALAGLRAELARLGVDRRLDLHNTLRSRRLWPWGATRLPKHRLQKWLLVHGRALPAAWRGDPGPLWRRNLRLVGVTEPGTDLRPRLVVEGHVLRHGARRHVALVPGAGFATKSWPEACWREFLPLLLEQVPEPVLLLGGAAEHALGERLAALAPDRVRNCCGACSLSESARLLADARFVVSGDTGLLHMADAAGVPGAALFGSTVRELGFYPLGESLRVLEIPLSCRPCSHVGRTACPLGHLDCLRRIAPRDVLAACLAAEAAC
ncbi:MAG: glycosyltransferase family 9 protein [Candidatus Delongbacteria bacterium]